MAFKSIYRILVIASAFLLTLSSCTKDNSVTIVEETESYQTATLRMNINDTEIVSNAVASHCQNDSVEFIVIASKPELLEYPFNTIDFEEGDFTYIKSITEDITWSYGGQAFGEDVIGFPGLFILFSNAQIDIELNDGDIVIGSAEGLLLGFDAQGLPTNPFPYEMEFSAEIIQESDYCD